MSAPYLRTSKAKAVFCLVFRLRTPLSEALKTQKTAPKRTLFVWFFAFISQAKNGCRTVCFVRSYPFILAAILRATITSRMAAAASTALPM